MKENRDAVGCLSGGRASELLAGQGEEMAKPQGAVCTQTRNLMARDMDQVPAAQPGSPCGRPAFSETPGRPVYPGHPSPLMVLSVVFPPLELPPHTEAPSLLLQQFLNKIRGAQLQFHQRGNLRLLIPCLQT